MLKSTRKFTVKNPTVEKNDVEKEFEGEIVPAPMIPSYRVLLMVAGFIGGICLLVCRNNISVAIVCMTISEDENNTSTANQSLITSGGVIRTLGGWYRRPIRREFTGSEECTDQLGGDEGYGETGEFYWSRDLQGIILAGANYGSVAMQLCGGYLATKFGPKWVIFTGVTMHTALTLLSPLASETSVYLLIAVQILKGAAGGVYFPAFYALWGKWAPPNERSKLVSFMFSGNSIGNIIALFVSGYLCEYLGWESVFYVLGGISVVFSIIWPFLVSNSPEEHPHISERERNYIINSIKRDGQKKATKEEEEFVPWRSILTSRSVWACAVSDFCFIFGLSGATRTLPLYMEEVMLVDISSNGLYSAMPNVCTFVMTFVGAALADIMLNKGFSKTVTRKFMQALGLILSAPCAFAVGFLDCTQIAIVVTCLCGWLGFAGFCRSGSAILQIEMAPRYAGIVQGITNTFGAIPGFLAPSVITAMTPNGTQDEWKNVFFLNGALYIFGGLVFVLFADGEVQSWAMPESEKIRVQSINKKAEVEVYSIDKGTEDNSHSYSNNAFVESNIDVKNDLDP